MKHTRIITAYTFFFSLIVSLRILYGGLSLIMYNWSQPVSITDPVLITPLLVIFNMVIVLLLWNNIRHYKTTQKNYWLIALFTLNSFLMVYYFHESALILMALFMNFLFICTFYLPIKPYIAFLGLYTVLFSLLSAFLHIPDLNLYIILSGASGILVYFIKSAFIDWKQQQNMFEQAQWAAEQFTRANVRLQEEVHHTGFMSRSRERTRVAREIHDTVGHTLTAILVQITAAKKIFKANPSLLEKRLENLEDMIRKAISDVRREVTNLREELHPGDNWRETYLQLCQTFIDSTGVRINRVIEEDLEHVDDTIGEHIYRILQEALTNSFRHGKASYIDVAMGREGNQLLVRISDNGIGSDNPVKGNGLNGMQERTAEIGGKIQFQTLPDKGFDIGIDIPWKERLKKS